MESFLRGHGLLLSVAYEYGIAGPFWVRMFYSIPKKDAPERTKAVTNLPDSVSRIYLLPILLIFDVNHKQIH